MTKEQAEQTLEDMGFERFDLTDNTSFYSNDNLKLDAIVVQDYDGDEESYYIEMDRQLP